MTVPKTLPAEKNLGFTFRKKAVSERSAGFTLVELLVVVAIIGILTSIAIASFSSFSRAQSIKLAALEVKSELRRVKTNSISGRKDAVCRADGWKSDGTPVADKVDDYSLIGHFVTLTIHNPISPPFTYSGGQHCTPSRGTPGFDPNPLLTTNILPAGGNFSNTISGNAYVRRFEPYRQSGGSYISCNGPIVAAGSSFVVEFFSINSNPFDTDPFDADTVGFYSPGPIGPGAIPNLWAVGSCTSLGVNRVARVVATLASRDTANCYQLTIESNGSVYEQRLASC